MKKEQALDWYERVIAAATATAEARAMGAIFHHPRLVHDEWEQGARWAGRWALTGWPSTSDVAGGLPRPGLRFEVWFRPGKAPDLPITLLLACADDPGLRNLHPHLSGVWDSLLTGGKAAGRYQPLARLEPLATHLEPGVSGVARQVPPDWRKLAPALEWLMRDSHKLVQTALENWHSQEGLTEFQRVAPQDPLEALRQRFSGGNRA